MNTAHERASTDQAITDFAITDHAITDQSITDPGISGHPFIKAHYWPQNGSQKQRELLVTKWKDSQYI